MICRFLNMKVTGAIICSESTRRLVVKMMHRDFLLFSKDDKNKEIKFAFILLMANTSIKAF
ncbi:hypothetical protein BAGA_17725 [Bacillus gaemokensis]|uniref:Uncharacterized protein n=1 Tax=Bacillus gaemokensis TaxID=574375 RepID=A0A073K7N3_9BACI|nr:hypothetical protein BAGA_17725 [Bacillus gaemokensis]KYG34606.1 hypothetical protein AZF08_09450 [Bacillus gaemokensis]